MSKTASAIVKITNKLGMHARPAMMFVDVASKHNADIRVKREGDGDEDFDGKSIMQVMMLAATKGTAIEITAVGADADKAVEELVGLVKAGFAED